MEPRNRNLPLLSNAQRMLLSMSVRPKLSLSCVEQDALRVDLASNRELRARFVDELLNEPQNGSQEADLRWWARTGATDIVVIPVACVNVAVAGNNIAVYTTQYAWGTPNIEQAQGWENGIEAVL